MNHLSQAVSIHPYFKVQEGKLDAFKEIIGRFIEKTQTEESCLYYDFAVCGDVIACREAYIGAVGILTHLDNVEVCIEEALTVSEMIRLEIHGPAAEIDQLREPLAALSPDFYVHIAGVEK